MLVLVLVWLLLLMTGWKQWCCVGLVVVLVEVVVVVWQGTFIMLYVC